MKLRMIYRVIAIALLCGLAFTTVACDRDTYDTANSDGNDGNNGESFCDSFSYGIQPVDSLSVLEVLSDGTYRLPSPQTDGEMSVELAIENRRSRRHFRDEPLTIYQLSQILWAAYGVTSPCGLRSSPSAGALYPLEVYAVVGNVEGLSPGVYRYIPHGHRIVRVIDGDIRVALSDAALGQRMVRDAPMSVFYSAVFERSTVRYGERGVNYVFIEVGHSAQNVYLQAESLGLGTCAIGAFIDDDVRRLLNLPADEVPVYLMPVGYVE